MQVQVRHVVPEDDRVHPFDVQRRHHRPCDARSHEAEVARLVIGQVGETGRVTPRFEHEPAEVYALLALGDEDVARVNDIVLIESAAGRGQLPAVLAADEAAFRHRA
jgi:hypothetical protein